MSFRYLIFILLLVSASAHAMSSLRVGDKVLTIGDSAARVQELMGPPTIRVYIQRTMHGQPDNQLVPGEEWQYAQDGKTIVVTILGGRATSFDTLYR
ncbi:DUF2845 domain-containing protein [Dyella flava]|uniref:DUF2845 domain-containing protein n=1 Tax=Dyella flava TaxID=1920170 RepID=A0ABS2K835_9GAMM|nr:DUF2845 domain-containing protein [Dyella flava]MBM7127351.1 DUF2845 domain-containing protein [Dyella flava]GLQ50948.1 hypothetical protein GCM10010872_23970 [Dyella flava]